MKELILNDGQLAIVDDKYFNNLNKFKWHSHKDNNNTYVRRTKRKNEKLLTKKILLHRYIFSLEGYNIEGKQIDHKNGNGLDNRIENLRLVTGPQNQKNRKINKNNKSGYKGVRLKKNTNKWIAQIGINNKTIYLGTFSNKNDAAKAYNIAAIKYFGEYANLNIV